MKVWDAQTGTLQLDLQGHRGPVHSASFSPDGTRIVTASSDGTAKVWDARTGTILLDLKGHTGEVRGVAFSPDGTRIVTGSTDGTAKAWDVRTGTPMLELKGHAGGVSSASFSPVGARIVSPDGLWFALTIGNYVDLIPTQPDEEGLADRRLVMQPNFRFYREAYDAAIKANDVFVAKFYLNLFPPPQRARIQADTETQAACLRLTGTRTESADQYNNTGWALVRAPGRSQADYRLGVRLATAACRLEPDNRLFLNTLGVAQYRCGMMAEALATLTRSNDRN